MKLEVMMFAKVGGFYFVAGVKPWKDEWVGYVRDRWRCLAAFKQVLSKFIDSYCSDINCMSGECSLLHSFQCKNPRHLLKRRGE